MATRVGVALDDLVAALDSAVDAVDLPADSPPLITGVALIEASDIGGRDIKGRDIAVDIAVDTATGSPPSVALDAGHPAPSYTHRGRGERGARGASADDPAPLGVDLVVLVGVPAAALRSALAGARARPRAIATKSAECAAVASAAGIAVLTISAQARWDRVLAVIQGQIDRSRDEAAMFPMAGSDVDLDLFGLVNLIADGIGGLVSIEDPTSSRVMAYSPSYGEADELRVLSILGRSGPQHYLDLLREWGVFEAIRRGGEVVDVPARPDLGMARRLVIGVAGPGGRQLGSIWVQEGSRPLAGDSAVVLRGAAAVASRILTRELTAPSTEGQVVQRLFGDHGGIDAASASAYLRIPVRSPMVVIGIAASIDYGDRAETMAALGGVLRLRASAFAASSVTAVIGERAYLLLPGSDGDAVTGWITALLTRLEGEHVAAGARLRAAVVAPIAGLAEAADARAECDRVLAATASSEVRVSTLAQSRTAVLLGEIIEILKDRPDVNDPRLDTLAAYDDRHGTELVSTVRAYLAAHGSVREAAGALGVHPNTLRYRMERAAAISGLRLDDPDDRLLTAMQLAVRDR